MTNRCRSCQAEIIWRRHLRTGKLAPLDAEPVPGGPIILVGDTQYDVIRRGDPTPPADIPRHTNHWQTCVDRDAWRRRYDHSSS